MESPVRDWKAKPPRGRLTFLYTDLTNSTGISNALGSDVYAEKLLNPYLNRHSEIFGPLGGLMAQFKGDGYIVIIEDANTSHALIGAVRMLESLRDNPIEYLDKNKNIHYSVKCRVSIYTATGNVFTEWRKAQSEGEQDHWVILDDAINLASRLESDGKSEQILFSQPTLERVPDCASYQYVSWGLRRLKGSPGPVDVHELVWDPTPDEPLKSRGEPGQPWISEGYFGENSTYIDRPDKEKDVLKALLDQNRRIVTIHASGGMGKTSLARRCAAKSTITAHFTDGVEIVLLEGSQPSVESVKEALCVKFGLKSELSPDAVVEVLRNKKRLLVLDNYESVKCPEVRDYLRSFLAKDAPIRFLITSRDPVGLPGGLEQRVSLDDGMNDDQADALLLDRVQAQNGTDWTPNTTDAAALKTIREATENNNPLALELIAAWVSSTYTLSEIAASLQKNLLSPFTTRREDDAPLDGKTRHLSLRDSLEWSYQMLLQDKVSGPFLTDGLARLSLFPGSFSRANVEGGSGYETAEADKLLSHLYGASLLRQAEAGNSDSKRYRFHRATREFAGEKLEKHLASADVRRKFVDYWETWLKENDKVFDIGTRQLLRQEWQTVVAALEIAEKDGNWSEVVMLSNLNYFLRCDGFYAEAERLINRALIACNKLERKQWKGKALGNLGIVHVAQNKFSEAEDCYIQSIAICREFDDKPGEGHGLNNLAILYKKQRKFSEAEDCYIQSLAVKQALDDKKGVGLTTGNLGVIYELQNRYDDAEQAYKYSLAVYKDFFDREGEGQILNNLACLYTTQMKFDHAEKCLIQSLNICREFGNKVGEGTVFSNLGDLYLAQNKFDDAEKAYNEDLTICREFGDKVGEGEALENLALLTQAQGKFVEALNWARQAVAALAPTQAVAEFEKTRQTLRRLEAQVDEAVEDE